MKKEYLTLAALLLSIIGCDAQPIESKSESKQISVNLDVDFQGVAENIQLNASLDSDKTVLDLLLYGKSNGKLDFKYRGDGETAFVESINGIENQMGDGSNWVFHVNGEMSQEGAGATKLSDRDSVLWKFSAEYLD